MKPKKITLKNNRFLADGKAFVPIRDFTYRLHMVDLTVHNNPFRCGCVKAGGGFDIHHEYDHENMWGGVDGRYFARLWKRINAEPDMLHVVCFFNTTHLKTRGGRFDNHLWNIDNGGFFPGEGPIANRFWRTGKKIRKAVVEAALDSLSGRDNVAYLFTWELNHGFDAGKGEVVDLATFVRNRLGHSVPIGFGTDIFDQLNYLRDEFGSDIFSFYEGRVPFMDTKWKTGKYAYVGGGTHPHPDGYSYPPGASEERKRRGCDLLASGNEKFDLYRWSDVIRMSLDTVFGNHGHVIYPSPLFDKYLKRPAKTNRTLAVCGKEILNFDYEFVKRSHDALLRKLAGLEGKPRFNVVLFEGDFETAPDIPPEEPDIPPEEDGELIAEYGPAPEPGWWRRNWTWVAGAVCLLIGLLVGAC